MLSVFRRPSSTLCAAVAQRAFALPTLSSPQQSASWNELFGIRSFATKTKKGAASYTAAVLEEYDKPLVLAKMRNDTPLGSDMVSGGNEEDSIHHVIKCVS